MKNTFKILLLCLTAFPILGQEQFDPTFAEDGILVLDAIPDRDDFFFDMIVLPDNKIIAVGYTISAAGNGNADMLIAKLNENGALDASFGGSGVIQVDIGVWDQAFSVIQLTNRKIAIAGRTGDSSSSTEACVIVLDEDGELDQSFAINGIFQESLGIGSSLANVLLEDMQGNIVVGANSNFDIHVLKLSPTGEYVEIYGNAGSSTISYVFPLSCDDMAWQKDGKLVISGKVNPQTDDIVVVRLNDDGTNDESFADESFFFYDFDLSIFGSDESGETLIVEEDGRILVGGHTRYFDESDSHFYVLALDDEGSFDTSFGDQGIQRFPLIGFSFGNDLILSPTGEIILAGGFFGAGSDNNDLSILRLNSQGEIDSTYGENGLQLFKIAESSNDRIYSIQQQFDDKWVVAGFHRPSGDDLAGFVARLADTEVTNIASPSERTTLHIFPNPVISELSFILPDDWITVDRIEIFNLAGNLVLETNLANNQTIEVSHLPFGFYSIVIYEDQKYRMKRFIKLF